MDLNFLRTVLIPILLFCGTVGNILSIITVTNRFCKRSSYTVYLTALAIFDILSLYAAIIKIWVPYAFGIHLTSTSLVYCKIHLFILSIFCGVSYWLIVFLAIERTFSLYHPHRAKSVCKPRTALMTIILLVVLFSCYSSHYISGTQLYSSEECCHDQLQSSKGVNNSSEFNNISNSVIKHVNNVTNISQFVTLKPNSNPNRRNGILENSGCDESASVASIDCNFTFHDKTINDICQNVCRSSGLKNETHNDFHRRSPDLNNNLMSTELPDIFNSTDLMSSADHFKEPPSIDRNTPKPSSKDVTVGNPPKRNLGDSLPTKFLCGFVDQGYKEFYRYWVWIDGSVFFCFPVAIIITCNTATWLKVYRSTRGARVNTTTRVVRRTRHVLILTTLISLCFILFVSPFTVLFVMESMMVDDIKYPLYSRENRKMLEFIAECLYLCNPSCNFLLYIVSGQRFRNSLKAAFCKPKSPDGNPDIIFRIHLKPKLLQKF